MDPRISRGVGWSTSASPGLPSAAPPDQRAAHPIVTEAFIWLIAEHGTGLDRIQVAEVLPRWDHFGEMSPRDMTTLAHRFPSRMLHQHSQTGDWLCTRCGKPWPCEYSKSELIGEFAREPGALRLHMTDNYYRAVTELPASKDALYERFLGWVTR